MTDDPINTFLQIKTHQLAGYSLHLERKKVSDDDYSQRYIPDKINIKFQNTYYNDLGTKSDSKVTNKKEVSYEYNSGYISELRWNNDHYTNQHTGMVDIPSFCIIFYNLETKIREILKINSALDQLKKNKKYGSSHLSQSDRLILKKNIEYFTKLKRTYLKELVGICKEHLFLVTEENNNKEEVIEVIDTN